MGLKLTQGDAPSNRWGIWSTTVDDFVRSGFETAEVDIEGRDATRSSRSLDQAIRYQELSSEIKSVTRDGRVWLTKREQPTPGTQRSSR